MPTQRLAFLFPGGLRAVVALVALVVELATASMYRIKLAPFDALNPEYIGWYPFLASKKAEVGSRWLRIRQYWTRRM